MTLAEAIFRQEGSLKADGSWNTAALGYRLNNPGNLAYAGQPGASPEQLWDPIAKTYVTYARFDTLENGVAATERQLQLDASRGLTLAQRLSTWATGNRSAYVTNVSNWLGVDPNTPLVQILAGNSSPPAANPTMGPPPRREIGDPNPPIPGQPKPRRKTTRS